MKKITGLKKAVGEYQRYNSDGYFSPEYAYLMWDKDTNEVWTDYFYSLGHNSWNEYHDDSIVNLGFMMEEQGIRVTMQNVKEFIERIGA